MSKKKTHDALEILHARYVHGKEGAEAELESAREALRLSMQLSELRRREGLTQKEVAERAGTTRSVIARLEQPGYEKHTVSTLHRVAKALGYSVRVEFVPMKKRAAGATRLAKTTLAASTKKTRRTSPVKKKVGSS